MKEKHPRKRRLLEGSTEGWQSIMHLGNGRLPSRAGE